MNTNLTYIRPFYKSNKKLVEYERQMFVPKSKSLTAMTNSKGCLYTRIGDWYSCTIFTSKMSKLNKRRIYDTVMFIKQLQNQFESHEFSNTNIAKKNI